MASRCTSLRSKFLVYCLLIALITENTLLVSSRQGIRRKRNHRLLTRTEDCKDSTRFRLVANGPKFRHGLTLTSKLSSSGRKRRFMKSRIRYYGNMSCMANFQIEYNQSEHILLSGDIQMNPGPIKNPCSVCKKPVATRHRAIKCKQCQMKCHFGEKCGKIELGVYQRLVKDLNPDWTCPACLGHIVSNRAEISRANISDRYIEDLKECFANTKDYLKVAHINVNGLMCVSRIQDIKVLIEATQIDILGITETKLSSKTDNEAIEIEGYKTLRRDRSRMMGVAV
eukprot:Seg2141.2 transcript_id=Seg2141.2/GoldUCD/mRNA.D3Y31 product="hypothetical protein" protein_id=Seg2141.2/GoldUCD/D3Y31